MRTFIREVEMDQRIRTGFWSEGVYSLSGTKIPVRLRRGTEATKWAAQAILGEMVRDPAHCHHISDPKPPIAVWGLNPDQLRDRFRHVSDMAKRTVEDYTRAGIPWRRRQKSSTPVVLVAVASWPEPTMLRSDERDRWQQLVIETAHERWGDKLKSVIAHSDESYYHLHLWIDDEGRSVKHLHAGFGAALEAKEAGKPRLQQAVAYREGCTHAQHWYHTNVGQEMGWVRQPSPRPRLSRSDANSRRQRELEESEEALAKEKAEIEQARRQLAHATSQLAIEMERQNMRHLQLEAQANALEELRNAVQDQLALEQRLRSGPK